MPELSVLQAERDGLKATTDLHLTEISVLQSSVAEKMDKLVSAEEQVLS